MKLSLATQDSLKANKINRTPKSQKTKYDDNDRRIGDDVIHEQVGEEDGSAYEISRKSAEITAEEI